MFKVKVKYASMFKVNVKYASMFKVNLLIIGMYILLITYIYAYTTNLFPHMEKNIVIHTYMYIHDVHDSKDQV